LLESVVKDKIMDHFFTNKLFSDEQFGFYGIFEVFLIARYSRLFLLMFLIIYGRLSVLF